MPNVNEDVMVTVQALLDYGVISEEGCRRFADFIRNLKAFAGIGVDTAPRSYVSTSPAAMPPLMTSTTPRVPAPMADMNPLDRVQTYDAPAEAPRQRSRRGSFNPTKEDLKDMRNSMTIKQIGEKYGVSMATVMNRLRSAGLTEPRNGGGKKGGKRK